jgi:hypothetical protein
MGHLLGNAVRLGLAHDVMAAGEGIETMLSLRCVMPTMPMVAALSAAHLAAILFPRTLRRLYIARDNDPAGDGAVANLIDRSREAGIEAITLSPRLGDFNEDLRAAGIDALRAAIRVQLAPEDVVRFMALEAAAIASAKVPSGAGVLSHPVAGSPPANRRRGPRPRPSERAIGRQAARTSNGGGPAIFRRRPKRGPPLHRETK